MTVLIKLYANNCGYCIDMIPEWEKLKILLGSTVQVIEIEHMELSESNNRLDIINKKLRKPIIPNGYPTIAKIIKNKVEYYNGPRIAKKMLKWVKSHNKMSTKKNKKRKRNTKKKLN